VGTLNGYAYMTNKLERAKRMWSELCSNGKMGLAQFLKSDVLQQDIIDLYDPNDSISSEFYCSLLELSTRNIVYKDLSKVDKDKIPLYLKATVALPVCNRAVQVDGSGYYDGATVDNIPVFPLLDREIDYIICIYFDDICYKFESTGFDNKIIKITFPNETSLRKSFVFQQDSIDNMLEVGYERTKNLLKEYFSDGYDNLEQIYRNIDVINQNSQDSRMRLTGDVIVTNFNRITQKLAKRKIL
jgi:predicted acylesterase/phospholipase RssA